MEYFKISLSIVLGVAILLFFIYKTYWKNYNIPTKDDSIIRYNREQQHQIQEDSPEYCQYVESIQSDIDKDCDIKLSQCYQDTKDLRDQLLSNQIKATDVIDSKHLLPNGIKIPKATKIDPEQIDTNPNISLYSQSSTPVNESTQMITNYGNFF